MRKSIQIFDFLEASVIKKIHEDYKAVEASVKSGENIEPLKKKTRQFYLIESEDKWELKDEYGNEMVIKKKEFCFKETKEIMKKLIKDCCKAAWLEIDTVSSKNKKYCVIQYTCGLNHDEILKNKR